MSHPQYPYSPVANDESHSLADFVNDPWWKWFRNWRHLTNRGRVLVQTRYLDQTTVYNAAMTATTDAVTVSVACSPLDRVLVAMPYLAVEPVASIGISDLRFAHNLTTSKLDGSHARTSGITRFPISRVGDADDQFRGDADMFGESGPLPLGYPMAVGGIGWVGIAEGVFGSPHRHLTNALARGGDTANNGALALTYRCSWSNASGLTGLDTQVRLRGLCVVAFRLQDL